MRIAIYSDAEEGHILPSFRLADALRDSGHDVVYLSLSAAGELVRSKGYNFCSIYDDILPGGTIRFSTPEMQSSVLASLARDRSLDAVVSSVKPDIFLVLGTLWYHGIALKFIYRVPVILYSVVFWSRPRREVFYTAFRRIYLTYCDGISDLFALVTRSFGPIRHLEEIVDLALELPQISMMPRVFAVENPSVEGEVVYTGLAASGKLTKEREQRQKPLVYCSLGGQTDLAKDECIKFFRTVCEAFTETPYQVVIATGKRLSPEEIECTSKNIELFRWVAQLEILKRTAVMIGHGGLGSVNECISFEVPMVLLPRGRDQFDIAGRVEALGIGVQGNLREIDNEKLRTLVGMVLDNPEYRARIRDIRAEAAAEGLGDAMRLVESRGTLIGEV